MFHQFHKIHYPKTSPVNPPSVLSFSTLPEGHLGIPTHFSLYTAHVLPYPASLPSAALSAFPMENFTTLAADNLRRK